MELEKLKTILDERNFPFFEDQELNFFLEENNNDLNKTAYELLIRKSKADSFKLGDTTIENDSWYWLRLARRYRGNQGVALKRADES